MIPWLSIVVPTIGRPSLARFMESASGHGVEIVLVADTHGDEYTADNDRSRALFKDKATWIDYDAGYHAWGHPQRNEGMRHATGEWMMFSQDDNVLVSGALQAIRTAIRQQPYPRPLLFQVDTRSAGVVWKEPYLIERNIDADCIVVPNDSARLGVWTDRFEGDYDFIKKTCDLWLDFVFCRRLISKRPDHRREIRELLEAAR